MHIVNEFIKCIFVEKLLSVKHCSKNFVLVGKNKSSSCLNSTDRYKH